MTPRDEYIEGRLLDADEQAEWEAIRNVDLGLVRPTVTTEQMIATAAKARARIEGAWAERSERERRREIWRRSYPFEPTVGAGE